MNDFEDMEIISSYSRQQAVEDGVLVEILRYKGRPVMATSHIAEELGLSELIKIFREFRVWRDKDKAKLPEEEQLFNMPVNGKKVWVIEDAEVDTIMYPEDY
jgi:hypothetical protein